MATSARPENPFLNLKIQKKDLQNSLQWFQGQIKVLQRGSYQPRTLLSSQKHLVVNFTPGRMYLYQYDAKWKDELPYWDAFPMIFPFHKVKDGFYGINIHYLPYDMRLNLFSALWDITNNKRMDATTRIVASWDVLSRLSKAKGLGLESCVKHYLNSQMRSKFLEIPASSWIMAGLLPIEAFQKASKQKVWHDTRNKGK